jgi:teichuronic acid biosynthesis glycosyltransferase TuaH
MSTVTMPEDHDRLEPSLPGQDGLSLAVADVGWFNTENLFREIDHEDVAVLLLKCLDYVNGWRRREYPWSPACRLRQSGQSVWERQLVLPSGWMKRYPSLGMRPIARAIRAWWDARPRIWRRGLVMSYPHYLYLREMLRPDVSVYYNIDDYSLYWPREAGRIRALELAAVRAADVTVCVSRLRTEELRELVPEAAHRIHHIPHGAPTPFLAEFPLTRPAPAPPDLAHVPRPYLGYIGSLEDRVDWELLNRLSEALPAASFVVLGRGKQEASQPWWEQCARFLSRPNVHTLGWRPQEALPGYYQAFDVTLIPYKIDHPFNRACNPTKIMDAMGSGRPMVASAIPECRLHAERFHVVETAAEFLNAIRQILDEKSDDGRARLRHAFARANSCRQVGERIVGLVLKQSAGNPRNRPAPAPAS